MHLGCRGVLRGLATGLRPATHATRGPTVSEQRGPHLLIHIPSGERQYCDGTGACGLCIAGQTAGEYLVYPDFPNVMLPPALAHQHAAGHADPVAEWADTATGKDQPATPQPSTQAATQPHRTMLNLDAIRDACGVDEWTPTNQAPSTQAPKDPTKQADLPDPPNQQRNHATTQPSGSTARETPEPQRSIKQAATNAGKQAAEAFTKHLRNQGLT